jgi:quinohemoprotein ethanol dehydrogenase
MMHGMRQVALLCAGVGLTLVAAATEPGDRRGGVADGDDWVTTGRTYDEQRYSPLTQIDAANVGRLGLAWYADLDTRRAQESTPLEVDGVLYVSTAWSKVVALDAVSGRVLWRFDPKVPGEAGARVCCDVVNRGVAYWSGRVYVGTIDGRLIALDARTGAPLWSTLTIDPEQPYSITGAPRVVKGKVIIGNGGAEFGVRGYVSAYDWRSGELAWRFWFVPGDPAKPYEHPILETAAKTWSGEWWRLGGGGTAWDSMAYDPELDLLYVGTGNGSPWNQQIRSPGGGDNLFLSSIVALRPETGEYVWHYQTTPGESWDYTATQHMILADVRMDGELRRVLLQAPKNGFFYVLERSTGKLISAKNFVPVNWATGIDPATGRPVENPDARYGTRRQPWLAQPGPFGAHNWQPMAWSPQTRLVYVPAQETAFPYIPDDAFAPVKLGANLGADMSAASLPQDPAVKKAVFAATRGHLLAWDPVEQREVWRVQFASPWNGGVLATAGNLVFQGTAGGEFRAYRADTGDMVWSFGAQSGIGAAPITYRAGGEQYVTVVTGYGGGFVNVGGEASWVTGKPPNRSRILTFKLGGTARLPHVEPEPRRTTHPPPDDAPAERVAAGKALYHRYCMHCHGDAAVSGGVIPDLRYSNALGSQDTWSSIVRDGVLASVGMVAFEEVLSADDAERIRAYVIRRSHEMTTDRPAR